MRGRTSITESTKQSRSCWKPSGSSSSYTSPEKSGARGDCQLKKIILRTITLSFLVSAGISPSVCVGIGGLAFCFLIALQKPFAFMLLSSWMKSSLDFLTKDTTRFLCAWYLAWSVLCSVRLYINLKTLFAWLIQGSLLVVKVLYTHIHNPQEVTFNLQTAAWILFMDAEFFAKFVCLNFVM